MVIFVPSSDETAFELLTRANLLSSSSESSDDDQSSDEEDGHRARPKKKLTPNERMLRELTSALKEFGGFECKAGMEHRKDVLKGMIHLYTMRATSDLHSFRPEHTSASVDPECFPEQGNALARH